MGISGVSGAAQASGQQAASPEQQALTDALKRERESQPTLSEMMKEAREKAAINQLQRAVNRAGRKKREL